MPQRVLIIDDHKPIHAMVRAHLRDEPLELHSAYDGKSGLELAQEMLPDLVLVDVEMPPPDGFEVCKFMRANAATMAIPIIFLTGAASTDHKLRGLELGAVDYITKPFDPAELRARVKGALRTKYLMDLLARKAMIDGLTGLWNRSYFDQRLAAELSLSRRSGHPLAVIMADIDYFKTINDRYGHVFGDEVLRAISQLIVQSSRTEDIVCRYGGEEFVIITPNTSAENAANLAHRLRERIEQLPLTHHGVPVRVTCSFGVANAHPLLNRSILEAADEAMYRAKRLGRNRVVIATAPAPKAAVAG